MNPQVAFLMAKSLDALRNNNLDTAELFLKQLYKIASKNPEVLRLLGILNASRGNLTEALDFFKGAAKLVPKNGIIYSNIGNVLQDLKQYEESIQYYDKAITLEPQYAEAYSNKGNALQELKRFDEALEQYNKAIAIQPMYAEAYNNIGNTLQELNQFEESLTFYTKAIQLNPRYHEAYSNKGNALHKLKRFDEALANYDQSLLIAPNFNDAIWSKSLIQLTLGNFRDGLQGYEYRDRIKHSPLSQPIYLSVPKLQDIGEISGKKILIWSEQGLGDTIQFCRYLPLLHAAGALITFVTQPPLQNLMRGVEGIQEILTAPPTNLSGFDFQLPLLSLPYLFKTDLNSIPSNIPYLKTDPAKDAEWSKKIKASANYKVGLVWNGGFRPNQPEVWSTNARRNIPLEKIARLQYIEGIDFFSLQKGDPAETELIEKSQVLWPTNNLSNFVSDLKDFSDTASLIKQLDLVIAVDTSTAHLAGAIGKPLWLLNRFDSCWRWLDSIKNSPWYPNATLYNQTTPGNWDSVLDHVEIDLKKILDA